MGVAVSDSDATAWVSLVWFGGPFCQTVTCTMVQFSSEAEPVQVFWGNLWTNLWPSSNHLFFKNKQNAGKPNFHLPLQPQYHCHKCQHHMYMAWVCSLDQDREQESLSGAECTDVSPILWLWRGHWCLDQISNHSTSLEGWAVMQSLTLWSGKLPHDIIDGLNIIWQPKSKSTKTVHQHPSYPTSWHKSSRGTTCHELIISRLILLLCDHSQSSWHIPHHESTLSDCALICHNAPW